MRSLKFGAAGMRGIVGRGLTPEAVTNFAAAFGTFCAGEPVMVATDSRVSSPMLKNAAIAALSSCGCEVVDAGIMPAGVVHYLIPRLKLKGGLLIGGGHQSSGWNAMIPLGSDGAYFNALRQRELLDIYHSNRFRSAAWDRLGKVSALPVGAVSEYWDALSGRVDAAAIRRAGLTIIVDYGNGAGAVLHEQLAERFGLKVIAINDRPNGFLPRDPEPRPRAGSPLRSIIKPLHAALGGVFNSDMSRLEIVTDQGEPLSEELTFPLAADYWLSRRPAGAGVVVNSCSSRTLEEVVAARGGRLEKTRVGQASVIDALKESNAQLAGEGAGSFACCDWVKGFDALYALLVVVEAAAVRGKTVTELVQALPRYRIVKRTLPCLTAHAYALIRRTKRLFPAAELSEVDGLRFDWPDGWLSIRLASTDQVIRLIAEADRPEIAREREMTVRTFLEREMNL